MKKIFLALAFSTLSVMAMGSHRQQADRPLPADTHRVEAARPAGAAPISSPGPQTPHSHMPVQMHGILSKHNDTNFAPTDPGAAKRAKGRKTGASVRENSRKADKQIQRIISFGNKTGLFKALKGVPLLGPNIDTAVSLASTTGHVINYVGHKIGNRIEYKNTYQSEHEKLYDQYLKLLNRVDGLAKQLKKKANPLILSKLGRESTLSWYEQMGALLQSKIWRRTFDHFLVSHGFEKPDPAKLKILKELQRDYKEALKEFKLVYRDIIIGTTYDEISTLKCARSNDRCQAKINGLIHKIEQNQTMINALPDAEIALKKRERFKGLFQLKSSNTLKQNKRTTLTTELTSQNEQIMSTITNIEAIVRNAMDNPQQLQQTLTALETTVEEVNAILADTPEGSSTDERLDKLEEAIDQIREHLGLAGNLPHAGTPPVNNPHQAFGAAPPPPSGIHGPLAPPRGSHQRHIDMTNRSKRHGMIVPHEQTAQFQQSIVGAGAGVPPPVPAR